MNWDPIIQTVVALASGAGGLRIVEHFLSRSGGARARLKEDFDRMTAERDTERDRADDEATRARILAESLSAHRRLMLDAGQPLPEYPKT